LCLAGYGLLVSVLAPRLLTRVAGGGCAPRPGIAAWMLAVGTVTASMLDAVLVLARSAAPPLALCAWAALAATLTRFGWAAVAAWRATRARRIAHGQLLAVVGRPDHRLGATLVDAAEPLVYCLSTPAPTVVVTTGARRALSRAQLRAALAHERAHLAGRHHLVLTLAYAIGRAVPWLPLFTRLGPALAGLLEMRADDIAAHRHGRRTVAAAIAAMSRRPAPAGALGVAGPSALARGLRLCGVQPAWRVRAARLALCLTLIALATGPYLYSVLWVCPHSW
jgi:Zn-dependent protease with chaperone function